jgi:hypothetical protein
VSELNTPLELAEAGFALRLFSTLLGHAIVFLSLRLIVNDSAASELAHTLGR